MRQIKNYSNQESEETNQINVTSWYESKQWVAIERIQRLHIRVHHRIKCEMAVYADQTRGSDSIRGSLLCESNQHTDLIPDGLCSVHHHHKRTSDERPTKNRMKRSMKGSLKWTENDEDRPGINDYCRNTERREIKPAVERQPNE